MNNNDQDSFLLLLFMRRYSEHFKSCKYYGESESLASSQTLTHKLTIDEEFFNLLSETEITNVSELFERYIKKRVDLTYKKYDTHYSINNLIDLIDCETCHTLFTAFLDYDDFDHYVNLFYDRWQVINYHYKVANINILYYTGRSCPYRDNIESVSSNDFDRVLEIFSYNSFNKIDNLLYLLRKLAISSDLQLYRESVYDDNFKYNNGYVIYVNGEKSDFESFYRTLQTLLCFNCTSYLTDKNATIIVGLKNYGIINIFNNEHKKYVPKFTHLSLLKDKNVVSVINTVSVSDCINSYQNSTLIINDDYIKSKKSLDDVFSEIEQLVTMGEWLFTNIPFKYSHLIFYNITYDTYINILDRYLNNVESSIVMDYVGKIPQFLIPTSNSTYPIFFTEQ